MPPHVLKKKKNGGHKINKIFNSAYFYLQEQHNIRSWNGQKCTRNGKLRVLKNACPKRAQFVAKCGAQEKKTQYSTPVLYTMWKVYNCASVSLIQAHVKSTRLGEYSSSSIKVSHWPQHLSTHHRRVTLTRDWYPVYMRPQWPRTPCVVRDLSWQQGDSIQCCSALITPRGKA